jgi:hypothetical protein
METDLITDPTGKLDGHAIQVLRLHIKGRHRRTDHGSGIVQGQHVGQMSPVQRGFPNSENQGTPFFEAHVGSSVNQVAGVTTGNGPHGTGGTGENHHRIVTGRTRSDRGSEIINCPAEEEPAHATGESHHAIHPNGSITLPADGISLDRVEKELIRQALTRFHGNQTRAARCLGMSRDTLRYRIKKLGIKI